MTRVRDQAAESPSSTRPVLLAWALAGALVSAPYVAATIAPPPGMTFVGTFHWIDDIHN